jgi:hypothetical protein
MTAQLHAIGENRVVSYLTVVSHVNVCHDPVVAADARYASVLGGSAVERAKLANGVVITNFEARCFAGVFLVLGYLPQRGMLEDPVTGPDAGVSCDDDVRPDPTPRANLNVRSNDTVGFDFRIRRELGARINDGGGMDLHVGGVRARDQQFSGPVKCSR